MLITTSVAIYAIWSIRHRPVWIDELIEEGGDLLFKPDESGKSLIDHLAARFFQSAKMSLLAGRSGEVRHQKMIESRVFDALKDKSPELKLALSALDQFGLGDLATPENLPALITVANKYGLFNQFVGKNTPMNSKNKWKF